MIKLSDDFNIDFPEDIQNILFTARLMGLRYKCDREKRIPNLRTRSYWALDGIKEDIVPILKFQVSRDECWKEVVRLYEIGHLHLHPDEMNSFCDLMGKPELIPKVVETNLYLLHRFLHRVGAHPVSEASQISLMGSMKKEFIRTRKFPTAILESVFPILNPKFKHIHQRKIEAFDAVPLVEHVPSHFFGRLLPFVPASTRFYRGLGLRTKFFITSGFYWNFAKFSKFPEIYSNC